MYWVLALHYWHLCETHKWNDEGITRAIVCPELKRLQPCRWNFCWSPVSFLEPVQPFTWQKSGRVSDQNYESMIIFLRPFLFPPIQWCTFTKNSFFLTQMLLWVRIQVSLRSYLVTFWSMIKNIFTRKDKNTHKNYLQYSSYERG